MPQLGRTLGIAAKVMRAHMDAGLEGHGSSLQTYVILRNIDSCGGLTQRALAARVGIEGPTVTHHLDRLATEGLIERVPHPDDRRAHAVHLTVAGHEHLDRVSRVAEGLEAQIAALFEPTELETLVALLGRVHDVRPDLPPSNRGVR